MRRWNAGVAPIAAEVLGATRRRCSRRRPEATIGDFITDAMRFASGADIALQNPGGMRADLAAGEITRGAIYEVMPFDNTIVTLQLTGADVKHALEQALRVRPRHAGERHALHVRPVRSPRMSRVSRADAGGRLAARRREDLLGRGQQLHGHRRRQLRRAEPGAGRDDSGALIRDALEAYVRDALQGRRGARPARRTAASSQCGAA